LLIVGAIAGFVCWKLVTDKQTEIDTLVKQKADGQVYAFARDLKANTVITPADITVIDIKSVAKTSGMYLVSNGNYTDGTWTSHSEIIYGGYVSANSKGTIASNRTSTGSTSTPSGTVAGATRTGTAVTIY
jgi:hypothetical protein